MTSYDANTTPLAAAHAALGARLTVFGGTEMPLRYGSELDEHRAVREAAGLFDLSHMGEIEVTGPEAARGLDLALASAPSKLSPGRARYSLLLDERGGILDDLIVYRLADERFLVVANAGNKGLVARELHARLAGLDATVTDRSAEIALIAVQGPAAQAILEATNTIELADGALDELRNYRSIEGTFEGASLLVARTGYTGEDGFELYVDAAHAVALWDALLAAGTPLGLVPCGLACRDTLRMEAGMPLYGQELGTDRTPAEAGLGRVVDCSKPEDFVGRAALCGEAADDAPTARVLVGLVGTGRRAGRTGYAVLAPGDDGVVGEVTSGALSPTLGVPIAMAYVDRALAEPDTTLEIEVRGARLPVRVVALPFYRRA